MKNPVYFRAKTVYNGTKKSSKGDIKCLTKMKSPAVYMGFQSMIIASVAMMKIVGTGKGTKRWTADGRKRMKRPEGLDRWTWEYPGYWSVVDEDADKNITVGSCGVQINSADQSVDLAAYGSEDDPKSMGVVELHDGLGAFHLDSYFLDVVYLLLWGENEFHRIFKST